MVRRASITFHEVDTPISQAVIKFGGQPTWLEEPQWPISRTTGNPMRFIGQIALNPDLFGQPPGEMAYIFMTEEDEFVDGTWEPDGGENAVIIQPGGTPPVPVQAIAQGPTLYKMVDTGGDLLDPISCEFEIKLNLMEDPDFVAAEERSNWDEATWEKYAEQLDGNKVGGTPIFLQADEFPDEGEWRLLLQLDATQVPFYVNFGDAGIGYIFLSESGLVGKFLWQCA